MSNIDELLKSCSGVHYEEKEHTDWRGRKTISYKFFKEGEIKLPDGEVFVEVTATATKGTIGRVVDLEIQSYGERYPGSTHRDANELMVYDTTIIYEVDGRKQKGRINCSYARILVGKHPTQFVRNVKKHDKDEVKNPVNKYKQEMQRGDWVVGVMPGKRLGIGRITRWTNHNVWGTQSDDLNDKSQEFKFDSIQETFTMPNDEHVQLLTWAVLKGWKGN